MVKKQPLPQAVFLWVSVFLNLLLNILLDVIIYELSLN